MNRTAAMYNRNGKMHYKAGKFGDAVDSFTTGITYDPRSASLRYNLAAAMFKNGDYDGASREAELTLAIDSRYDKARELLDVLQAVNIKNE